MLDLDALERKIQDDLTLYGEVRVAIPAGTLSALIQRLREAERMNRSAAVINGYARERIAQLERVREAAVCGKCGTVSGLNVYIPGSGDAYANCSGPFHAALAAVEEKQS
jgi:hypothetical protein